MINMCKYCRITPQYDDDGWYDYRDNELEIADEAMYTTLYMGIKKDGRFYIAASGDNRAFYYPKYCHECGRKL